MKVSTSFRESRRFWPYRQSLPDGSTDLVVSYCFLRAAAVAGLIASLLASWAVAAFAQDTGCGAGEGSLERTAVGFAEDVLLESLEGFDDAQCVWFGGPYDCIDQGEVYPNYELVLDYPQARVAHGTLTRSDVRCPYYDFSVGCGRGADLEIVSDCQ